MTDEKIRSHTDRARRGNLAKGAAKLEAAHKLFVRDRIGLLVD